MNGDITAGGALHTDQDRTRLKRTPTVLLRENWHTYTVGCVDRSLPGLYEWRIEGAGVYVGKYTNISRPEREYARNLLKMLNGWPYRPRNPDGFRTIHRALLAAYLDRCSIQLTLIENGPAETLSARERQLILERGTLNGTRISMNGRGILGPWGPTEAPTDPGGGNLGGAA